MNKNFIKMHRQNRISAVIIIALIASAIILAGAGGIFAGVRTDDKASAGELDSETNDGIQITGLKLAQEGTDIKVSWDEISGCTYELVYSCRGGKTFIYDIISPEFTIGNCSLSDTYRISVRAIDNAGNPGQFATAEIETDRISQDIGIEADEFTGFTGEGFFAGSEARLTAEYYSSNDHIAEVDEYGNVTMKNPGDAVITIRAAGNGIYEPAEKKIQVHVYPTELAKPELEISKTTDNNVTLSWNSVKYATGYKLLRYNPATGKYTQYKTIKNGKTSVKLTRLDAKYKIKAYTKVRGEDITSASSNKVKVVSRVSSAKVYSSLTNVRTITLDDVERIASVTGSGAANLPQSMAFTGTHYIAAFVNRGNSTGALLAYKQDGTYDYGTGTGGITHANGSTYNPNTGNIYVATTYAGHRTNSLSVFDAKSLKSKGTISLARSPSGIAYDETTDEYYMTAAERIYIADSDFNINKIIYRLRDSNSQDAGAYNGVVLSCIWTGGTQSYIDMYRASDGVYLGSINLPFGEIESAVVDDGHLVMLFNVIGSSTDAIYKTKEKISLP